MKVFCIRCSKEFKSKPSRIAVGKDKYCSLNCRWFGKRDFKRKCIICSKDFVLNPARSSTAKYCSFNCYWGDEREPVSLETRKKISDSMKQQFLSGIRKPRDVTGEKHPMWKGGVTPINKKIRQSREYKKWRTQVFERDDYTCQSCLTRGGDVNAHHIKRFADFPELRLELSNGMTLCVGCHRKTFVLK